MMVFLEDIVNSALDLEGIETFSYFKVCLASLVQSTAGYFPSHFYILKGVKNLSDTIKNIKPGVFFNGTRE